MWLSGLWSTKVLGERGENLFINNDLAGNDLLLIDHFKGILHHAHNYIVDVITFEFLL